MTENTTTAASGAASPLTDDQIKAIHHDLCTTTGANYLSMARAVEAAHGITEAAPAAQEAEPAMATPCGACGQDYGVHEGTRCPIGVPSVFRPAIPPAPQADAVDLLRKMREWYGVHATLHYSPLLAQVDDLLAAAPQAPAAPTIQAVAWRYSVGIGKWAATTDEASAWSASFDRRVDALGIIETLSAPGTPAPAAAVAPATGAAPTDAEIDDLCREIGDYDDPKYFRHMVRAVLARWGAAAPAPDAPRLIGVDMAAGPDATAYWTAEPAPFQQRVQPWLMECFGPTIAGDREERNHRFLEETLELVQACGCSASEAHQLVNYVFGRPVGEPAQEVGGVMVTLAALCLANGLDMHAAGETELARIWTKVEAIRAKQAAKPKHSPLPEHTPTRAADSPQGAPIVWPKARDVGRIGDMSPSDSLRVGLDGDNDVYVSVCGGGGVGSVEFCTPGPGGGKSRRTRVALLALMVAMEADNADDSGRDWWARRMGGVTQEGGS